MKNRVQKILISLEDIKDDLLGYSDDVWLEVDHNDSEELKKAFDFKIQFNEKFDLFAKLSDEISKLIQQQSSIEITKPKAEEPTSETKLVIDTVAPGNETDKQEGFGLNRSFTYTKPKGYILEGIKYKGALNWKPLYRSVCEHLEKKNYSIFKQLATSENMITSKGNKMFSNNPDELRQALSFESGVYAESNLSADQFRNSLILLLKEFGIDQNEFRVLLRYDPEDKQTDLDIDTLLKDLHL